VQLLSQLNNFRTFRFAPDKRKIAKGQEHQFNNKKIPEAKTQIKVNWKIKEDTV
jgi:hypothetical protein